jgi:hypothetical protein
MFYEYAHKHSDVIWIIVNDEDIGITFIRKHLFASIKSRFGNEELVSATSKPKVQIQGQGVC